MAAVCKMWTFLSTLPARGATIVNGSSVQDVDISIHAPREGSDGRRLAERPGQPISIHAPREGSDLVRQDEVGPVLISIHAPREGSDPLSGIFSPHRGYFYPRSPRGERPAHGNTARTAEEFLSTLPARGAT